jgi:hypothetical protein
LEKFEPVDQIAWDCIGIMENENEISHIQKSALFAIYYSSALIIGQFHHS